MSQSDVWQRRAARLHELMYGTLGLQLYEIMEHLDVCYFRAKTETARERIDRLKEAYHTYLFFLWKTT